MMRGTRTVKRLLALLLALTMALSLLSAGAWAVEIDPEETEPSITGEEETLTDDPAGETPDPEPEPEPEPEPAPDPAPDPEPPAAEEYQEPEEPVTDEAMGDADLSTAYASFAMSGASASIGWL